MLSLQLRVDVTSVLSLQLDVDVTSVLSLELRVDVTSVLSLQFGVYVTSVLSLQLHVDVTSVLSLQLHVDVTLVLSLRLDVDVRSVLSLQFGVDVTSVLSLQLRVDVTSVLSLVGCGCVSQAKLIAELHRQKVDQDQRLNAFLCKQLEAERRYALVYLTVKSLCDAAGIALATRDEGGSRPDEGATGSCNRGVTERRNARTSTLLKRQHPETDTKHAKVLKRF